MISDVRVGRGLATSPKKSSASKIKVPISGVGGLNLIPVVFTRRKGVSDHQEEKKTSRGGRKRMGNTEARGRGPNAQRGEIEKERERVAQAD